MEYELNLKVGEPPYKNGLLIKIRLDELPSKKDIETINDAVESLNDTVAPLINKEK